MTTRTTTDNADNSAASATRIAQTHPQTAYWRGVRVGQCQTCQRNGKAVTRHGLCWLCESEALGIAANADRTLEQVEALANERSAK